MTQPLAFEFQGKLMVTCKILNEGTALGMEQGRWVEDDGEGAENKKRGREKTFTCSVILIRSPSLPGAGGGQVSMVDGASYPSGILPPSCTLMIIKHGTPVSC